MIAAVCTIPPVNLDRHTGFVKGYALVEFAEKKHAQDALEECNGSEVRSSLCHFFWIELRAVCHCVFFPLSYVVRFRFSLSFLLV